MITFRAPVTLPLLPAGTPKPAPPNPRAYDTFRVTQRFGDRDSFYADGRSHNATDVGNFRCGEPVVAMAPGIAYHVEDNATALGAKSNALGIRIDHGQGVTSEYWHLDSRTAYNGQPVNAGFQIGTVGRTGLGDVCHVHVEVKVNGVRIDPEPLMFGGSLMEDTVLAFGANQLKTLNSSPEFTTTADAWFRSEPRISDDTKIEVLKAGTVIRSSYLVTGDKVGDSSQWIGPAYKWVGGKYRPGFVHSSVLKMVEAPAGGITQEQLDAAVRAAFVDAKTKARLAVEEIKP